MENYAYKNPDGMVTEYRFDGGKFIGLFNDGVQTSITNPPIGTELTEELKKNLSIAGFKLLATPKEGD